MKVYNEKSLLPLNDQLVQKLQIIREKRNFDAENYVNKKASILNEYMRKFHLKSCVVAVSSGIDSAIVLGIVNYAMKLKNSPIEKVVPLLLPIMKSTGVTNQDKTKNYLTSNYIIHYRKNLSIYLYNDILPNFWNSNIARN